MSADPAGKHFTRFMGYYEILVTVENLDIGRDLWGNRLAYSRSSLPNTKFI
jgi:hypothetical protein